MDYYEATTQLTLEQHAVIWWAGAQCPNGWASVAGWCFGAASVACTAEDRRTWDFLRAIAWSHAGVYRQAREEVAA